MGSGKFDTYWMDACWHQYMNFTEQYSPDHKPDKALVWTPVPYQFPNGMRPIADAAHDAGLDFMLWFEPERIPMNYNQRVIAIADGQPAWNSTKLRASADGEPWTLWAFKPDANLTLSTQQVLLNYGNPEALAYMQRLIAKRIDDWSLDLCAPQARSFAVARSLLRRCVNAMACGQTARTSTCRRGCTGTSTSPRRAAASTR